MKQLDKDIESNILFEDNHIIVAEGSWWGSDMVKLDWTDAQVQATSGISSRWDNNLVYQTCHRGSSAVARCHRYRTYPGIPEAPCTDRVDRCIPRKGTTGRPMVHWQALPFY